MIVAFLTIILTLAPYQASGQVSYDQKKSFIELLKNLPVDGEFYTEEGVNQAASYLPVPFSLTEKDIENYDIYPFLALSRGLCDHKDQRDYAVEHFAEIRHPLLKLGWGAMLFDAKARSPEVVQFLRNVLKSEKQSKILADMIGPDYQGFKQRVNNYPHMQSK